MAKLYDYFERALSWHYLVGETGQGLWRTLGAQGDAAFAAVKEAVMQRFLGRCHDEAVPWIAQTFHLDYPARFTPAQARSYIGDPFAHWEDAGSKGRMEAEIRALGFGDVEVITYRDLVDKQGEPAATTFGGISSFWFVRIKPPFPWPWGVAGKWGTGAKWGAAPFRWGTTATWEQGEEIRRVIRKWSPAGTSCRFIEVWLRIGLFGVPLDVRRWPVRWDWELDANGAGRDFYNYSYEKEVT